MKNPVFWVVLTGIGIALIQQGKDGSTLRLLSQDQAALTVSAFPSPSLTSAQIAFFRDPASFAPQPVPLQQRQRNASLQMSLRRPSPGLLSLHHNIAILYASPTDELDEVLFPAS
ncbi:hypothetical protein E1301_Tti000308 [Triplophysa tibetana]|uniref:Uncharacterized protein n=1 Tax=Triplophysa tibetana TaxID=1572043 RepID=A0A5A9N496_9TELE|nr:hypothetical protein E1301_Tti000308 [Triplophysa tibetana]